MGFKSRKLRFHREVDQEYKNRMKIVFQKITDEQIPSFSKVASWEIVRDNPDKPWDWIALSQNPKVATWEIVKNNPDKPWNWYCLSSFLYQEIEIELGRKYLSAYIIQNRWRNISVDQKHPLGYKVIMGRIPSEYYV